MTPLRPTGDPEYPNDRFNANGTGALLTTLPNLATSLVIDAEDRLFAWTTSGVFLVDPANPVPHLISPLQSFPDFGSLVLAPGNARLYAIAIDFVYSIDIATGQTVSLGANPAVFPYFGGIGAALYVPEPSASNSAAMLVAASLRNRRREGCQAASPPRPPDRRESSAVRSDAPNIIRADGWTFRTHAA